MQTRLGGTSHAALVLAAVAALWVAAPAQAARYWTVRPVAPSPLLWLGATPGSPINAASLSTPTAGNTGQHWTMIGGNLTTKRVVLKNRQTGTCLDLQNLPGRGYQSNNHRVVLNRCGYFPQLWGLYLPPAIGPLTASTSPSGFQIRNLSSDKCLGVPYFQYAAGIQLQQYTCSSSYKQRWRLSYFDDP